MVKLLLVLLVFLPEIIRAENQLSPVINDLSIVARLINGISVQSEFMRSSQNLNTVVGELLGIGDSIPELLKVKVKDLMEDVQGVMEAVKNVSGSNQNLGAISDTVPFLKSIELEKLKKAVNQEFTSLHQKWTAAAGFSLDTLKPDELVAALDSLKYILETPISDDSKEQSLFFEKLQDFVRKAQFIGTSAKAIIEADIDKLWGVIDSKPMFDDIPIILKVSKEYSAKSSSFDNLVQALTALKTSLTDLDPVIKKIQTISTDTKSLEIIDSMFSSDKLTDKKLTAGFYNGISDLKMLFDDLNGKWLKENVADGKDMKMMVTALEPLKKFYENLKPLETSWGKMREDPQTGRNVGNIASILMNGRLLNSSTLPSQVNAASKCKPGLFHVSYSSDFSAFDSFYNSLEKFDEELKKLQTIVEPLKKLPVIQTLATFHATTFKADTVPVLTRYKIETDLKRVTRKANINETVPVMTEYLENLKKVDIELLKSTFQLFEAPFSIKDAMVDSKLVGFIECLNKEKFDFTGTAAFSSFQKSVEVIKAQKDTVADMQLFANAIEPLTSAEKKLKETVNGMKVSSRRRKRSVEDKLVKGVLKLADSWKVARELGNGVQVLREMSEVFENQGKVLKVAKSDAAVDDVIKAIPEMDGKWTDENKKALEKLVDEVNKLNLNVEKDRSLRIIWKLFGAAQSVNGAPIESRILGTVVFEALDTSSVKVAKDAAPDFKDFPPLQLDFTSSKKTKLRDAFMILQTVTGFFNDFFSIDTSSNTSSQQTDPPPNYLLFAGAGAGVLLFVAVLVGGYFGFRSYKKKKILSGPERFLIYITFKQVDEKIINDVLRNDESAEAKELIKKGVYLSMHDAPDGKTPLHLALDYNDPEVLELLIMGGADRLAKNAKNETPEEMIENRLKEIVEVADLNQRDTEKVAAINRMKTIFKNHKERTHQQKIPPLLPLTKFSVFVPFDDSCKELATTYPGRVSAYDYNVYSTTHCVLPVDKNGVVHFQKESFKQYFEAIFGPAVVVPVDWAKKCAKDSAHFYKDYERRVTKVEFNGKTYATLDKLKEFARGRHVKVGAGFSVCLLSDDYEDYQSVILNMGFIVHEYLTESSKDIKSFWRPEMKHFIVYDGPSIDQFADKLKGVDKSLYNVMSFEEFTALLLAMEITGVDGADKLRKAQMEKEKKGRKKKKFDDY